MKQELFLLVIQLLSLSILYFIVYKLHKYMMKKIFINGILKSRYEHYEKTTLCIMTIGILLFMVIAYTILVITESLLTTN